jgi:5'(3')-deoxyribonucleotidase
MSSSNNVNVNKPIVAVDIDEVLAYFIPTLAVFHNDVYGPKDYLTSESFISYEFHNVWGGSKEECSIKMEQFFQSKYFYNDIKPIDDAYNILLQLKDIFELHIVTARQHKVSDATTDWINKHYPNIFTNIHFGNHYSTTGISKSKAQLCKEINAIMLIDDSPAYAINCAENDIPVILFGDYSWNRHYLKDKIEQWSTYVKRGSSSSSSLSSSLLSSSSLLLSSSSLISIMSITSS